MRAGQTHIRWIFRDHYRDPPKAAWHDLPSWFVVAKRDNAIPAEAQRFAAKRMKARVTELDASHAAAVSRPGEVFTVITKAAAAVR
ncbi:alpha/beta fold hydrolase [Streptosporangium sp. NPDC023825]|uniref:alpha/beta fold hydrolase n=1 Tax=Streptosporangium sp. NPDC023825 TaxID=3154909 RepID=UPI00342B96A3